MKQCRMFFTKTPQFYLQASTENLPNMEGIVSITTNSWSKMIMLR